MALDVGMKEQSPPTLPQLIYFLSKMSPFCPIITLLAAMQSSITCSAG